MTRAQAIALTIALALSPLSLSPALALAHHNTVITEDDERWDCVTMGDRICGPSNSNGVPAGCYDDGGVLVSPWPCRVVVNPDGTSDVYR